MLRAMLRFDPSRRLTVDAALSHPYLSAVRNESKEVVATAPMSDSIESVGEDQDHLHSNVRRTSLLVRHNTALYLKKIVLKFIVTITSPFILLISPSLYCSHRSSRR
jgi:serine/threonine protein kinase